MCTHNCNPKRHSPSPEVGFLKVLLSYLIDSTIMQILNIFLLVTLEFITSDADYQLNSDLENEHKYQRNLVFTPSLMAIPLRTYTNENVTYSKPFDTIASSSDGTNLAVASFHGYIYSSVDSGVTWNTLASAGANVWNNIAISDDGTKMYASPVQPSSHLYVSHDSGTTWTQRGVSDSYQAVGISRDGTIVIASTSNNKLLYSSDSGVTFTSSTGFTTQYVGQRVICSNNGSFVAVLGNSINKSMYLSYNSGSSFTISTAPSTILWGDLAMTSDCQFIIMIGSISTTGYLYTSSTNGQTWDRQMGAGTDRFAQVSANNDGSLLAFTKSSFTGNNLYLSQDYGVTWNQQTHVPTGIFYLSLISNGLYLASSNYTQVTIMEFVNTTASPTMVPTISPTYVPTVSPTTTSPTLVPTLIPTIIPTNSPSFAPTASRAPTLFIAQDVNIHGGILTIDLNTPGGKGAIAAIIIGGFFIFLCCCILILRYFFIITPRNDYYQSEQSGGGDDIGKLDINEEPNSVVSIPIHIEEKVPLTGRKEVLTGRKEDNISDFLSLSSKSRL